MSEKKITSTRIAWNLNPKKPVNRKSTLNTICVQTYGIIILVPFLPEGVHEGGVRKIVN